MFVVSVLIAVSIYYILLSVYLSTIIRPKPHLPTYEEQISTVAHYTIGELYALGDCFSIVSYESPCWAYPLEGSFP